MRYAAFGLELDTALELPGLVAVEPSASAALELAMAPATDIDQAWSGPADRPAWRTVIDGRPYSATAGVADDLLLTWGEDRFLLDAARRSIRCSERDPADAAWQRLLLDSVLVTAAMRAGFECLHAGAVLRPEGVVAVTAPTGGGKTTLIAELVRSGDRLFCDDIVAIADGRCHPGPGVMNLPAAGLVPAAAVGTPIAPLDDEIWTAVPVAERPAPLAALVVLERGALEAGARLEPHPSGALAFTAASLHSGDGDARRRARFEAFADLAERTACLRLLAAIDTSPAELAKLVHAAGEHSVAGTTT